MNLSRVKHSAAQQISEAASWRRSATGDKGSDVRARCARLSHRVTTVTRQGDRGDVPGWVMVTLMTAGLVIGLWAFAGNQLQQVFGTAMERVLNF